jgi:hypothetical protein
MSREVVNGMESDKSAVNCQLRFVLLLRGENATMRREPPRQWAGLLATNTR